MILIFVRDSLSFKIFRKNKMMRQNISVCFSIIWKSPKNYKIKYYKNIFDQCSHTYLSHSDQFSRNPIISQLVVSIELTRH